MYVKKKIYFKNTIQSKNVQFVSKFKYTFIFLLLICINPNENVKSIVKSIMKILVL